MRSNVYLDSTFCKADRQLVSVIGVQNESSLFSRSLSDLFNHKLKLSHQLSAITSKKSGADAFKSQDETGQTNNRLLPDEEELFSGIVDELGLTSHANAVDELGEIDLFTCSGGIKLESDHLSQAGYRNVGHSRDFNQNQHSIPTSRYPDGVVLNGASRHEYSHNCNVFQSPVRLSSIYSEFGVNDANMRLPNVGNIVPNNSLDGVRGIAFCSNGTTIHQSLTSKSNSYKHRHLRSLLVPNSPSFLTNNHAPDVGGLPGSPGAPHFMTNMASPVHRLQVGSAPAVRASIWDRQQIYSGESREVSDYQMDSIKGVAIARFSPSHTPDISSHVNKGVFAEIPKKSGVYSAQQISHIFHERNVMNSSYGSPSECVRGRRNETHFSHADRKLYELNIDCILRGEDSRTTLMIKNIPNKYTSKMLLAAIDEQHRGKYDFIYLPIDFKNKCNMGYAFINMVGPLQIVAFHQTFEGRKWEKFNSIKVAKLAYARIQGKAALIAHFQNSSLMNEDRRCRPILFHTDGPNAGDQEPFPVGTSFRLKHGRLQATANEDAD